ncbi:hypothetical protein, partial [Thermus scotoductus]|uniref:hypothetical protein n=1 Tax=Thermus scotoductus TaxID=37636 RepID=UPI001C12B78C
GLPFPSLLPSRSSGGYPDPWGTSSPVGTPIHTHTLTHNSLHDRPRGRENEPGKEVKGRLKILRIGPSATGTHGRANR